MTGDFKICWLIKKSSTYLEAFKLILISLKKYEMSLKIEMLNSKEEKE